MTRARRFLVAGVLVSAAAVCRVPARGDVVPTPTPASTREALDERLLHAVLDLNLEEVKRIAATAGVRGSSPAGNSALIEALATPRPGLHDPTPLRAPLVEALLAAGADPNERGPNRVPPLVLAAQDGHVDVVRALLKRGARVDGRAP